MNLKTYFFIALTLILTACSGTKPTDIGVKSGQLKACPSSPNCVSSQGAKDVTNTQMPLPLNQQRKYVPGDQPLSPNVDRTKRQACSQSKGIPETVKRSGSGVSASMDQGI